MRWTACLAILLSGATASAATLTVTTTSDTFDGVCDSGCSIRDALEVAANGDVIVLPAGTFALSRTGPEAENFDFGTPAVFDLDILNSVTIQGQGPGNTIIDGTGINSQVFEIPFFATANVTIRDLTITGGNATSGGIYSKDRNSSLNIINCDISGNTGNGIGSVSDITITDTTISGNTGAGVRLTNDHALFNFLKDLTIRGSTLSGNQTGISIFKADTLLMENSTLSGNTLDGLIAQRVIATIKSSTFAYNGSAGVELAGFTSDGFPVSPVISFRNTIIANNTLQDFELSGPASPPTSNGNNLLSDNSASGSFNQPTDMNNVDPQLMPLDLNGSTTTRTHAFPITSPAFNNGNSLLATDQRGVSRPQGGTDDIGAFELIPPDDDMDGFSPPQDCDDNNEFINPDAPEVFDGVDNNCDGTIDEGFDDDGDGFEDTATGGDDCDDTNEFINPGAVEVCDGVDNNCADGIDEGFDQDADGFTTCENDCDDDNEFINPDAAEICDGVDNNCDGETDEGCDEDEDGFNTPEDCDDSNEFINPDAPEVFDGVDNNCDGTIDEGFDDDADGFEDTATGGDDCDDENEFINPDAAEVFDGIDNNCDGTVDEMFDDDGDGFLDDGLGGNDCDDENEFINPDATEADDGADNNCDGATDEGFDGDEDGFTPIAGGDCDDGNEFVNPGADEIFDGIDNNCDGTVDEVFDDDGDGSEDTATGGEDCDDDDDAINPGAAEVFDGIDNNCDGTVDEGFDDDLDGFLDDSLGGNDCNDDDAAINPDATEVADGVDNDCDGTVDPEPGPGEDGVDDATEDGAPNNGDGNNDGTPDRLQDNVTSLPNADGNYLTIVSPAGTTLANVVTSGNPSPGDAPEGVSFPVGFVSFEVRGVTPGASAQVQIIADLPAGAVIDTHWKYGPEPGNAAPHWYEYLSDGTTGAVVAGNVVTLNFVDGQRGDDDLNANGVIVDPSAPATAPQVTPPQQTPDCGTGLCGTGSAMCMPLMLLSLSMMRRRNRQRRMN